MIAIQKAEGGFDGRWISYCQANRIQFKIVDCFRNDIFDQLKDCSALMWQIHQGAPRDILMAKELLYAVRHAGIRVFPDFSTAWHFDDKVGQKYLLEAIKAPMVPTWIFFSKDLAVEWVKKSDFPIVLKLRGGAGSQNVYLVESGLKAKRLIRKAFGRGLPAYNATSNLKERWRLYKLGKTNFHDLLKGIARFIVKPKYARLKGPEKGYIYFQKFISGNEHDIRVIVIGDKAFAIKRIVRENDFRASGSKNIQYERSLFDMKLIGLSFELAERLKSQCVGFDYVIENGNPMVLEMSYGFTPEGYDPCPGYWDKDLTWHEGKFNPFGWIVENLIKND
jgi:glutathione synthase/RimK-type ligase-like ATP-grasp enzyme